MYKSGVALSLLRGALLVASCLLLSITTLADEGAYLAFGIGGGEIEVDQNTFDNANLVFNDVADGVLVADYAGGYRFANNLSLDLSYEHYDTFSLLFIGDRTRQTALRVGGGYHFPSEGRFSAFVKGGVSFWDLDFKESALFNPGIEETGSRDGSDLYVQVGAELTIVSGLFTRLSYDYSPTDFGSARSAKLWVGWNF